MAVVTYGVTSPELTLNIQMELTDADAQRIVAYLMATSSYVNADGSPVTPEQVVAAYGEGVMNTLLSQTYSWDQGQAASSAAAGVQPITPVVPPHPIPPAPEILVPPGG